MPRSDRPAVEIIHPRGELCEDTIDAFEQSLLDASGDVVVDASEVTLLSAAAMRILVRTRARLAARGGSIRVANASAFVTRTLAAAGLDDVFGLSQPRP